ncbi:DNA repair protein RecO [Fusobacterium hwasookii]|uniref:DNA repair protein RecO n=1 Tax=Fusobacterium hwasookii ChDC F128 TaxID=1216362 RepID=A0ABN0GYU0_9FUSO|nr:DNA repair protein RecO [Fusobacterium hwasookii]EJU07014.1 DNA repair protein recO [Fusobacterium hwasookii ChDC F128]QNE66687.1 DNA repair protein RecO [Fusobacterium hwasookii]
MIFLRGKGIIIAKKDIEEADRYITIFMEDYGKVSTVIKGIRKSKKRDKTAVDILSLTDFQFYKKNDSLVISNFSTVKDYIGIKSDIDKINIAFYIFSILNQILVENGRNRKIYEVLEKTLDYLNISSDERKNYLLILFFLNTIIKEEGISIENSNNIEELQVDLQNQRRVEIEANVKEILQYLFQDNLKVVINDEKYKIDYVRKTILVLENYINFHLDTNINAQKILWGALLW